MGVAAAFRFTCFCRFNGMRNSHGQINQDAHRTQKVQSLIQIVSFKMLISVSLQLRFRHSSLDSMVRQFRVLGQVKIYLSSVSKSALTKTLPALSLLLLSSSYVVFD